MDDSLDFPVQMWSDNSIRTSFCNTRLCNEASNEPIVKIHQIAAYIEDVVEEMVRPPKRTLDRPHQDEGQTRPVGEVEDAAIGMIINTSLLGAVVQQDAGLSFAMMVHYQNCCMKSDLFSNRSYLYPQCTRRHCSNKRKICCSLR